MVHNADVATDGALPDKEDRDVCGAFPMRKANATGAGIGSRRVSIALENSTERSWRESSQGSSVPRRSMSNLQPTQQSRSRRASRVSGEGSNQPQATGAGKKRSSSGTIEGHDCDGSRPSSGKAGVASIFGSLVQVSNRHMLRLLPGHKERSSHGRQKRRSSWGLALGTLPQGPDRRTSFTGGEKGKN